MAATGLLSKLRKRGGDEVAVMIEQGPDRIRLSNGSLDVEASTGFGPRILFCGLRGGRNLMAQLPTAQLDWRPERPFNLHGGHRFWVAPEVREVTYTPDDSPVAVSEESGGVRLTTPPAPTSPFERTLVIRLDATEPRLEVTHRLRYTGDGRTTAAPWAITMLPRGGHIVLPFAAGDAADLQANRNIVFWPYTRIDDPLVDVSDQFIVMSGERSDAVKLGTLGLAGWGAYVVDGSVLIKRAAADPAALYPDLGASLQAYVAATFCELETLGPLATMAPGDAVEHDERWELHEIGGIARGPEEIGAQIAALAQA